MQRVLITGAGWGIGLELARQYAARGDRVLAGCRAIERAGTARPGRCRCVWAECALHVVGATGGPSWLD
jgi:NAD(P)-dependent dehydrogenase (short-subunit alcohol dehydrogenase family)